MSITVKSLIYKHPDKDTLFQDISFSLSKGEKASLIGNNGVGKSTLLQIISEQLTQTGGEITLSDKPYYVPQHLGQYDGHTIAQVLGVEKKLNALQAILKGDVSEENLTDLDEDWDIEDRVSAALAYWRIDYLKSSQTMNNLSGGEKTKVFLSGILLHSPEIILLDEPSNHLDFDSRNLLYDFIANSKSTILVVSHDRTLLNLLDTTFELNRDSIIAYGGNYDFYKEQKEIEQDALNDELKDKEKLLRKSRKIEQETKERQQKLDARGKKKAEKEGVPTIMMKTMKNRAENSTARLKDLHAQKMEDIRQDVVDMRKELFVIDKMKIGFNNSTLHKNKILATAKQINWKYGNNFLWKEALDFQIVSGERIAIKGVNGSGKTTLIKLILGELQPLLGTLTRAEVKTIYIDQNYSLIDNQLAVYQQAEKFNDGKLQESEVKTRLNRFLFTKTYWDKPCSTLSGGERMRLVLCCMSISNTAPDIIILDEPTNNLDIQNIEILTAAINEYQGTLIVVSHDTYFLEQILISKVLYLE
ncbi:MAG: ATP-binding cassette domain-containing protein [Prevotella sp.]|jgi:ATPase subunit of ABC transporter with duplicated ATPase domains|nr:ATP-binding cassette domain-containing protein [Prevotella sp.]